MPDLTSPFPFCFFHLFFVVCLFSLWMFSLWTLKLPFFCWFFVFFIHFNFLELFALIVFLIVVCVLFVLVVPLVCFQIINKNIASLQSLWPNYPPNCAITLRDNVAKGVSHLFCFVFVWESEDYSHG